VIALVLRKNSLPCYIIILIAEFFFVFPVSFPLGNMLNYCFSTYVKCIFYVYNRADVSKHTATLLNKRGWDEAHLLDWPHH